MRRMLVEHLDRGGQHDDFIVRCLSSQQPAGLLERLSERERVVLEQLRTSRTTAEISALLCLSVNTVKTHQKSIYRKLGVTSRREAVRLLNTAGQTGLG